MDIDTLRKRFPDEDACRKFFEAVSDGQFQQGYFFDLPGQMDWYFLEKRLESRPRDSQNDGSEQ